MSMLVRDLVVIEASGKLRQLHRVLDAIGLRANCLATLGHVLESPPHLRPLAIRRDADGTYHETRRIAPRPEVHARLREALQALRGRLFIATDDDQEGHAIAQDVAVIAKAIRPDVVPMRLLAGAVTEEAFRAALTRAQPLTEQLAMPAVTRRIADRIIASAFSRPEDGLVVGRVAAAVAGLARDGVLPAGVVTLEVPAQDGRGAFVAQAQVRHAAEANELIALAGQAAALAADGVPRPCALQAPPTHASFLMAMNDGGQMSLSQAAQLLQGLYERGVVSYPRTEGQQYRAETRARLAQMGRAHGLRTQLSPAQDNLAGQAHEPLHIVDPQAIAGLNLLRPARLQRDDRSVALAWISRQMLASLITVQRENADARALPAPLGALDWQRSSGPVPTWYHRPRPGLRTFTPAQSLLQGMVDAGIGRPSTYVGHAMRAIERGIVASDNTLGLEGRRMLGAAPPALARASVARAIEQACDQAPTFGVGPTVDHLLALATQQDALLGEVAALLQSTEWEEPAHAFTP